MDMEKIIKGLEQALMAVNALTPLAEAVGGNVGHVAGLAGSAADIANNVLDRIKEGALVATSREQAVIVAINRNLAESNDRLAKAIATS